MEYQDKKTLSVREMGKWLGLKKVESYWLVHRHYFDVVKVGGRMRVDMDSFEHWYAGQVHYRKVTGEPPGIRLKEESFGLRDIAEDLNISEYTVHDIIKRDKIPTVKVDYHRRILKRDYEQWYSSQLKYRNAEDRFRDAVAEMNSITMPEMAHMLGVERSCVYSILRSAAGKKQLNVVAIGGRKRITRDSFENWYKSQNKYVLRERKALKTQKSRQDEKGEAMTKSANPKYLTVQEAAALAGVTIKKVLYWVRGNRFPVVRVSSLIRIEKQGFQTYLRGIGGE